MVNIQHTTQICIMEIFDKSNYGSEIGIVTQVVVVNIGESRILKTFHIQHVPVYRLLHSESACSIARLRYVSCFRVDILM